MNNQVEKNRAEQLDLLLDKLYQGLSPGDLAQPQSEIARLTSLAQRISALGSETQVGAQELDVKARVKSRIMMSKPSTHASRPGWRSLISPAGGRLWVRLASAAMVVALAGILLWTLQPRSVDAQAIVQKAQAAMASVPANLHSFAMTQVITDTEPLSPSTAMEEQTHTTIMSWYQAPNLWHSEDDGAVYGPDGKPMPGQAWHDITVSDGKDMWSYDAIRNEVVVNRLNANTEFSSTAFLFGTNASNLTAFLKPDRSCPDARTIPQPRYLGHGVIAGRPTYVIDLGRLECPFAPGMNGRRVIWVDQETFYVLKNELHRLSDDRIVAVIQVTSIRYNIGLSAALFQFTPPPDAKVLDLRNRPAPATSTPSPAQESQPDSVH